MGQQQLLLIILGVIIVGIAIAVGLSLFTSQSIQSNKDGMINDINNIAANAYQFYIRPASMGGGAGAYTNYKIPVKMSSNENGTYSASGNQITGTSANGTVVGVVATDGRVQMSFTGNFAQ
jgi:hypothetical protein